MTAVVNIANNSQERNQSPCTDENHDDGNGQRWRHKWQATNTKNLSDQSAVSPPKIWLRNIEIFNLIICNSNL